MLLRESTSKNLTDWEEGFYLMTYLAKDGGEERMNGVALIVLPKQILKSRKYTLKV